MLVERVVGELEAGPAAEALERLRAGRLRSWLRTAVTAGAAWAVVNAPIALLAPENWSRFFRLNSTRPADPDTIWNLLLVATDRLSAFDVVFDQPIPDKGAVRTFRLR